MADLAKLSVEELEAENEKLMAEKDELRAQQEELQAELSARANAAWAENLSDAQRKAVLGVAAEAQGGDS